MNGTELIRRADHPFTGLIEGFFDESLWPALRRLRALEPNEASWLPAVDLAQTPESFRVTVDLPGLRREDINLTVENNTLTLSGERKFEKTEAGPHFDRIERAYGKFSRTFHLPTNVDNTKVEASFENGVLTVEIPKAETAKSRQIDIK